MSDVVLDASALLALLLGEPGGDQVATIIASARIGAVNLAEVVSHFVHLEMPPTQVEAMLRALPLAVLPADQELALAAGNLRAATAPFGLSLGDRFCLALAQREGLPTWTADRAWSEAAQRIGVQVVQIR